MSGAIFTKFGRAPTACTVVLLTPGGCPDRAIELIQLPLSCQRINGRGRALLASNSGPPARLTDTRSEQGLL
jgi:hypothetical protein